jgi:hypothetical protein
MSNPNHDPDTGKFSNANGHNAGVGKHHVREHLTRQHKEASGHVVAARRDLEQHLREILRTRYKQV